MKQNLNSKHYFSCAVINVWHFGCMRNNYSDVVRGGVCSDLRRNWAKTGAKRWSNSCWLSCDSKFFSCSLQSIDDECQCVCAIVHACMYCRQTLMGLTVPDTLIGWVAAGLFIITSQLFYLFLDLVQPECIQWIHVDESKSWPILHFNKLSLFSLCIFSNKLSNLKYKIMIHRLNAYIYGIKRSHFLLSSGSCTLFSQRDYCLNCFYTIPTPS